MEIQEVPKYICQQFQKRKILNAIDIISGSSRTEEQEILEKTTIKTMQDKPILIFPETY